MVQDSRFRVEGLGNRVQCLGQPLTPNAWVLRFQALIHTWVLTEDEAVNGGDKAFLLQVVFQGLVQGFGLGFWVVQVCPAAWFPDR